MAGKPLFSSRVIGDMATGLVKHEGHLTIMWLWPTEKGMGKNHGNGPILYMGKHAQGIKPIVNLRISQFLNQNSPPVWPQMNRWQYLTPKDTEIHKLGLSIIATLSVHLRGQTNKSWNCKDKQKNWGGIKTFRIQGDLLSEEIYLFWYNFCTDIK